MNEIICWPEEVLGGVILAAFVAGMFIGWLLQKTHKKKQEVKDEF